MVIQHNISAMNTNRQLKLTTGRLAKSSEKLSGGYRINRAADDAAGLSISEKMRKQIRGLDQAGENIEDGISLCQVADGALNETICILQRMRELAVQSANGTNAVSDRKAIDTEIDQLKNEVDRIAVTTKFNDAVYPLNAPIVYSDVVTETIGSLGSTWTGGLIYETTLTFEIPVNVTAAYDGKFYTGGDIITITGITANGIDVSTYDGLWTFGKNGELLNLTYRDVCKSLKLSDLKHDENGYIYYINEAGNKRYALYSNTPNAAIPFEFDFFDIGESLITSGSYRYVPVTDLGIKKQVSHDTWTRSQYYFNSNEGVSVHAGASSSQTDKIPIHIVNATCKGLGITELSTATEKSSGRALKLLDNAISKASSYRSAFGATQNRLERARKIDDSTVENTQAAESQIRDTDMAAEMIRYANVNILMQAGQSMLAQANQSRQGVLSLVA